jgi:hypothetical protein
MRSTRVSPSKFFGDRYTQYVDELTAGGTIAGKRLTPAERKEGFKKRGDKISFENFVNKVLEKKTGPVMSGGVKALPGGGRGGAIVKSSGGGIVQSVMSSPVAEGSQDILGDILRSVNSILATLQAEEKFKKNLASKTRRQSETVRRGAAEDKLESNVFKGLVGTVQKAIAPVKSLLDKLFNFFFMTFVGRILTKLVDWWSDEENKEKLEAIGRFLKDNWPLLLGSFLLFGNSFGRFISKLVFTAGKWLFKLTKVIIPKLFAFIRRNPRTAALIAGGTMLGYKLLTDEGETGPEEPEQFSSGGRVPGTGNKDTVHAMLTPGEFVMSRGAVNKFGVNTMRSMNSAGGGSGIPSIMSNGMFGYSQGGGPGIDPSDEPGGRYTGGRSMAQRFFDPLQVFSQDKPDRSKVSASSGGQRVDPLPTNFTDKQAFMHIYNIAKKVGGTKWPEIVAAQAMHETGYLKAKPSVYFATGKTNPFGQTGDRGYGTIPRQGDPAGWTKYPNLEEAVRDHIKLWHNVGNHPENYNAYDTILDGIAVVAKAYSPNSDPANIRLGYTTDAYSKGMVRALKTGGFNVKTTRQGDAPRMTPGGTAPASPSRGSYSGSMTATKTKPKVKPMSRQKLTNFMDSIRQSVDGPAPTTPSPGNDIPDFAAGIMHDPRKIKVLGIG